MDIAINIPDKKIGDWAIESFNVSGSQSLMTLIQYKGRIVNPGRYKKLTRCGQTIMSNTNAEINDFIIFYRMAKGDVLINGLGLGVCLKAILKKKEVVSVTVIEKSEEVIKLVSPHIIDKRVTIIHADAFKWKPPKGKRYNAVWHDIWDNICTDNIPGMARLHRKYGKKADWQGSWCKYECKKYLT